MIDHARCAAIMSLGRVTFAAAMLPMPNNPLNKNLASPIPTTAPRTVSKAPGNSLRSSPASALPVILKINPIPDVMASPIEPKIPVIDSHVLLTSSFSLYRFSSHARYINPAAAVIHIIGEVKSLNAFHTPKRIATILPNDRNCLPRNLRCLPFSMTQNTARLRAGTIRSLIIAATFSNIAPNAAPPKSTMAVFITPIW